MFKRMGKVMHKRIESIGDLVGLLQALDPETRIDSVVIQKDRPDVQRVGVTGHVAQYVEFHPVTYQFYIKVAEPEKFERDLRNGMEKLHE